MRFLGCAAAAASTVLLLTGCGSQATQPTRTPTVTVAPVTSTPTPTPTPSLPSSTPPAVTPTATTATNPEPAATQAAIDPNRPANQCPDDVLGVAIAPQGDGHTAGASYSTVYITNTGGTTCVLRGAPGVSVVGRGNGTQLGAPAERFQTGATTVRLDSGETAVANLKIVAVGANGSPVAGCTLQKGDGYRVYPPHSLQAIFVKDPKAVACAPGPVFLMVGPVEKQAG